MSSGFNPYFHWLGIPLEEQPPSFYGLLGVQAFEGNIELIAQSADQRIAYLNTQLWTPQGQLAKKLLDEVLVARACLLDPQQKKSYDQKLQQEAGAFMAVGMTGDSRAYSKRDRESDNQTILMLSPVAILVTLISLAVMGGGIYLFIKYTGEPKIEDEVAQEEPETPPDGELNPDDQSQLTPTENPTEDPIATTPIEDPVEIPPPVVETPTVPDPPVEDPPEEPPPTRSGKLVHHWKFDELTGDVAKDSVGNNNATLFNWTSGRPKWTIGRIDGALNFSDTDNLALTELPIRHEKYTIAFWLNLKQRYGINPRIFTPRDVDGWILINNENQRGVGFYQKNSPTGQVQEPPQLDAWEHYAIVFDHTEGTVVIYRNGRQAATGRYTDKQPQLAWIIGHHSRLNDHRDSLQGLLDDLRVYDYLLSVEEVRQLAAAED